MLIITSAHIGCKVGGSYSYYCSGHGYSLQYHKVVALVKLTSTLHSIKISHVAI